MLVKDSGSSNLGFCENANTSLVQANQTQFSTCVAYEDDPPPYFTGYFSLGNILVGAPDAGQAGSVGAAPLVFDDVGLTIMNYSSHLVYDFNMCADGPDFYDGVLHYRLHER